MILIDQVEVFFLREQVVVEAGAAAEVWRLSWIDGSVGKLMFVEALVAERAVSTFRISWLIILANFALRILLIHLDQHLLLLSTFNPEKRRYDVVRVLSTLRTTPHRLRIQVHRRLIPLTPRPNTLQTEAVLTSVENAEAKILLENVLHTDAARLLLGFLEEERALHFSRVLVHAFIHMPFPQLLVKRMQTPLIAHIALIAVSETATVLIAITVSILLVIRTKDELSTRELIRRRRGGGADSADVIVEIVGRAGGGRRGVRHWCGCRLIRLPPWYKLDSLNIQPWLRQLYGTDPRWYCGR